MWGWGSTIVTFTGGAAVGFCLGLRAGLVEPLQALRYLLRYQQREERTP
jgi:hypothetical protein